MRIHCKLLLISPPPITIYSGSTSCTGLLSSISLWSTGLSISKSQGEEGICETPGKGVRNRFWNTEIKADSWGKQVPITDPSDRVQWSPPEMHLPSIAWRHQGDVAVDPVRVCCEHWEGNWPRFKPVSCLSPGTGHLGFLRSPNGIGNGTGTTCFVGNIGHPHQQAYVLNENRSGLCELWAVVLGVTVAGGLQHWDQVLSLPIAREGSCCSELGCSLWLWNRVRSARPSDHWPWGLGFANPTLLIKSQMTLGLEIMAFQSLGPLYPWSLNWTIC